MKPQSTCCSLKNILKDSCQDFHQGNAGLHHYFNCLTINDSLWTTEPILVREIEVSYISFFSLKISTNHLKNSVIKVFFNLKFGVVCKKWPKLCEPGSHWNWASVWSSPRKAQISTVKCEGLMILAAHPPNCMMRMGSTIAIMLNVAVYCEVKD